MRTLLEAVRTAQTEKHVLLEPVNTEPITIITRMAMMMTITALTIIRCTMVMMMVMLLVISVVRRHGKSKIKVGR